MRSFDAMFGSVRDAFASSGRCLQTAIVVVGDGFGRVDRRLSERAWWRTFKGSVAEYADLFALGCVFSIPVAWLVFLVLMVVTR